MTQCSMTVLHDTLINKHKLTVFAFIHYQSYRQNYFIAKILLGK